MAGAALTVVAAVIETVMTVAALLQGVSATESAAVLTAAATALTVAAIALMVSAAIPIFHKGGLITAHQGWGPDSRLIHAQTGEGIINRGAMRRLERNYGPGTFGYLNRGQMPPGAGGGAGGGGVVINNHFPNQSQVEVDRFARRLGWALRRQDLGSLA